jgi:Family of unknown function (DUF6516)
MVSNAMIKALLIYHDKALLPENAVVEMKIWRLPTKNKERPHGLKYSLFYGENGKRVIGYDNERGKGDHRHIQETEESYTFIDVETLIADFLADVRKHRRSP